MNIQNFFDERFGNIRTFSDEKGVTWFVGKDIAEALGYKNTKKALKDHVNDKYKLRERIVTSGQRRQIVFISEPGVYQLINSSKMEKAVEFQDWLYEIVLPSIRKHGSYIDPNHESVRSINILIRKYETSAIARLIDYGRRQGYSINETQVYSNLTYRTQTEFCGIPSEGRDEAESSELLDLIGAESIVINTIYRGILYGMRYPAIYNAVLEGVKYHFLDDLKFVHDKKSDIVSVEVKEKNHNIVVKWDGIKVKIPKKE